MGKKALKRELLELRDRVTELEDDLIDVELERDDLEGQVGRLESENESLRTELDSAEDENLDESVTVSWIRELEQRIEDLEDDDDSESVIDRLADRVGDLENQVDEWGTDDDETALVDLIIAEPPELHEIDPFGDEFIDPPETGDDGSIWRVIELLEEIAEGNRVLTRQLQVRADLDRDDGK